MGSISRAARSLDAQPILAPTEEVCAALRALHPQEQPPPVPTSGELPAAITQEILTDVLKALPQGSAAGPSGWTYEQIKAATTSSEEARAVVLRFVQALVRGDLPHLPRLLDARLLPLAKPHGRGVRPIAIGEVWYRLAALCALAACPNIGRSMAPLQLAVGISGGSQIVGHALRAGMAADPGCVTVQVDWRNAFNTVRRDRMLAAVAERCPALLPMVAWAYGRHSRLLVQRSDAVVSSQSGVRQGDPLGPLLFALTLQGPLEQVAEMGLARPVAFADDTFLQGAPAPTMRAFHALTALAAPLGLSAQPDKCAVYSEDAAAAASVATTLGMHHAPDGLLAAGTPVGAAAFAAARAATCADHACALMDQMQALPLADQDRWLLLHGSLQRRVAHLPRGNQWEQVGLAVQRAERKAVDCALAIIGHTTADGPLTEQATLPLRHGGLGLSRTSPALGSAAYLAASAAAHIAMRSGPEAFRPFSGPSGEVLRPQWEALHDVAGALWKPELKDVHPDRLGHIAEAQGVFSRHESQARFDALLASYDATSVHGRSARARLLSCSCRPASAWLDTLPLSRALELKSGEVRTGLRHRLGLSMLPPNAPAVQCTCGATLRPSDADHGMRCPSLAAQTTMRHDILKGILRRVVHRAGIASTLEPPLRRLPGLAAGAGIAADGSPLRPEARGDILLALPRGITVSDLSVIHPLSINTLPRAATTAGAAASHRDQQKRTAYARVEPNGYGFVPFSVETYGRIGQPAMKLLHDLGEEAAGPGGVSRSSFVAGALRELSVGLCRGNFIVYRASLGVLARSCGSGFRPGLSLPTDDPVE
jgi:hypothetical protein